MQARIWISFYGYLKISIEGKQYVLNPRNDKAIGTAFYHAISGSDGGYGYYGSSGSSTAHCRIHH